MKRTLREIAGFVDGEIVGNGDVEISGINSISDAAEGELAFVLDARFEPLIAATKASALVVSRSIKETYSRDLIKVDSPSMAFTKIIEAVMPDRIPHPKGIHRTAIVSDMAKLGRNTAVGPYVVIEDGVSVGDDTVIYPFTFIGRGSKIGSRCVIYANCSIREAVSIGDRVIMHPGCVIGSDGFGFDTAKDGTHMKIPQMGTVVVEDDVELGAGVCVDRARFNKTVIGKGTKIDNLVQIAHNVIIGPNCLIAAQGGIGGSTELGRNVTLGGQVGITDHVKLGDFVISGAKTGISKSFPPRAVLFGIPAKPLGKAKTAIGYTALLPKLFERMRALENKVKELESGKAKDR